MGTIYLRQANERAILRHSSRDPGDVANELIEEGLRERGWLEGEEVADGDE